MTEVICLNFIWNDYTSEMKAIVIIWLGYPRKEGYKNDCHNVFTKMVDRGKFPENLGGLIATDL